MTKNLLLLFALVLIAHADDQSNDTLSSQNSSNTTTTTTTINASNNSLPSVTKGGNVPIYKDSRGFYVGTDLEYDYSHASNYFGTYTGPIKLGLYTSQTLLSTGCVYFSTYDCSEYGCTKYTSRTNSLSYPYFTATGYYASAEAYLDYSGWNLNTNYAYSYNYNSAFLTTSCSSNAAYPYGYNTIGVLGMGISSTAQYNFQNNQPVFSIYLYKNNTGGQLMFKKDLSYAKSSTASSTFTTSNDWEIYFTYSYFQVGGYSFTVSTKLIFDLDSDTLGLPSNIYWNMLKYLSYYGVSCSSSTSYQPSCSYSSGYVNNLPQLSIYNISSSQRIIIPPQLYIQDYANQTYIYSFTLNMKALGSNYTGSSYVTNAYSNCIILGSSFMTYYYTIFQAPSSSYYSPQISIYTAGYPPTPYSPDDLTWAYIVAGSVAFLLIFACICCCFCAKINNKARNNINVVPNQAPLIVNDQTHTFVNDQTQYVQPAYTYDQNAYTQYGQYSQQPQAMIQNQQQFYGNAPGYNYIPSAGNTYQQQQ